MTDNNHGSQRTMFELDRADLFAERGYTWRDVTTLRTNRLLRSLSYEELSELLSAGRSVVYDQNEVISHQAQPVDTVLFIVDGRARAEVSAMNNSAFKAVVNFLGPGDDVGLLSLVDRAPHSASVTALESLRAVSISMETMQSRRSAHPEWYRALAEIAVERLRTSGVWLQALI